MKDTAGRHTLLKRGDATWRVLAARCEAEIDKKDTLFSVCCMFATPRVIRPRRCSRQRITPYAHIGRCWLLQAALRHAATLACLPSATSADE